MDLKQLQSMGLVLSNPIVKREFPVKYHPLKPEVEWVDGQPTRSDEEVEAQVDVWLRKFTAADKIALSSCKSDEYRAYLAIQRSTFTEKGDPLFPSLDDAFGLDLAMFSGLITAINELNGVEAKKSQPRTNGGVNSPSLSADEASPNGKKSSPSKK